MYFTVSEYDCFHIITSSFGGGTMHTQFKVYKLCWLSYQNFALSFTFIKKKIKSTLSLSTCRHHIQHKSDEPGLPLFKAA